MTSHTKLGQDQCSSLSDTNKQTDKQSMYIYIEEEDGWTWVLRVLFQVSEPWILILVLIEEDGLHQYSFAAISSVHLSTAQICSQPRNVQFTYNSLFHPLLARLLL